LELHLNSWINHHYEKSGWITEVPGERIREAKRLHEERKGNNQDLTLLECLQLCDKRELLLNSDEFLQKFKFTKNRFRSLLGRAEKIRNELAHSQNSIIANIEWDNFIETIDRAESFLIESDGEVERLAKEGADFQDLLI